MGVISIVRPPRPDDETPTPELIAKRVVQSLMELAMAFGFAAILATQM